MASYYKCERSGKAENETRWKIKLDKTCNVIYIRDIKRQIVSFLDNRE